MTKDTCPESTIVAKNLISQASKLRDVKPDVFKVLTSVAYAQQ